MIGGKSGHRISISADIVCHGFRPVHERHFHFRTVFPGKNLFLRHVFAEGILPPSIKIQGVQNGQHGFRIQRRPGLQHPFGLLSDPLSHPLPGGPVRKVYRIRGCIKFLPAEFLIGRIQRKLFRNPERIGQSDGAVRSLPLVGLPHHPLPLFRIYIVSKQFPALIGQLFPVFRSQGVQNLLPRLPGGSGAENGQGIVKT